MGNFAISDYFDATLGLDDIYAASKVEIGKKYMAEHQIDRAVLIGDSTHDFEVADAIGADCILVSNGHQSAAMLEKCGVTVLENISELSSLVL